MSRPSFVATAGGFCMAGSSRPAEPVNTPPQANPAKLKANDKAATSATTQAQRPAEVI